MIYIIFYGSKARLLKFRLHQLYVPSLGRYFLPLPKLTKTQLEMLSRDLKVRGYAAHDGVMPFKLTAVRGSHRIASDGWLGLAGSNGDMLDAIAPSIPALLASPTILGVKAASDEAAVYYALKRAGASTRIQLFPRMESMRMWGALRKDGLCGLTPDEAAVVKGVLGNVSSAARLECVTSMPREDSKPIQVGTHVYFQTSISMPEFLRSLMTIDSSGRGPASFLPRGSVLVVPHLAGEPRFVGEEVGEWCFRG